jgi:hypothetical protein
MGEALGDDDALSGLTPLPTSSSSWSSASHEGEALP